LTAPSSGSIASATRSRSFEGTGIGLAPVQELVKLHGGTVRIETGIDRGSRFVVSLPVGSAQLPAGCLGAPRPQAAPAPGADAFVEEILRWLPGADPAAPRDDSPQRSSLHMMT
jgi:hypothetical protein